MNGDLSQSARGLSDAHRGAFAHKLPTVEMLLEDWRARWSKQRQFGVKQDLSLPPLTGKQAQEANTAAFDHYWSGSFASHGDYQKMLTDCRDAILVARYRGKAKRQTLNRNARLRVSIEERDGSKCWVCGNELGEDSTIEHKVALANGGTWSLDNLALAHLECNRALARLPVAAKRAVREVLA